MVVITQKSLEGSEHFLDAIPAVSIQQVLLVLAVVRQRYIYILDNDQSL